MDAYLDSSWTNKRTHVQILKGDITTAETDVVVVFRSPDGTIEGESLRVLKTAGMEAIEKEYQTAKLQEHHETGKRVPYWQRLVGNQIVLTGAGDLKHPKHILVTHFEFKSISLKIFMK